MIVNYSPNVTGIGREKKDTGGGGGEGGWVQPERFELLIPQQKKNASVDFKCDISFKTVPSVVWNLWPLGRWYVGPCRSDSFKTWLP